MTAGGLLRSLLAWAFALAVSAAPSVASTALTAFGLLLAWHLGTLAGACEACVDGYSDARSLGRR